MLQCTAKGLYGYRVLPIVDASSLVKYNEEAGSVICGSAEEGNAKAIVMGNIIWLHGPTIISCLPLEAIFKGGTITIKQRKINCKIVTV